MNIELKKNIVYVTRDIERALGMNPTSHGEGGYFIITNDTTYGREIRDQYPKNVFLLANSASSDILLDTYDLLTLPETERIIREQQADIVVFQNTTRIERHCSEKGWRILNPSATLSKKVEEKISQVEWLGNDARFLPPHTVRPLKDVSYAGKKIVLQFNHAHTGEGTHILHSEETLKELAQKFPNREVRVTDFIDGPIFTLNAVVDTDRNTQLPLIIAGTPSYQITGLTPFTDLPFSTIGNDWSLPQESHYKTLREQCVTFAESIGTRLHQSGWKGLFGIDVVYDPATQKTYLLEINARQPASTTFESIQERTISPDKRTLFETHMRALSNSGQNPITLTRVSGAQIVKRGTHRASLVDIQALRGRNLHVIEYKNSVYNKELFRIQATTGIMKDHNSLNELGEFIRSCIR